MKKGKQNFKVLSNKEAKKVKGGGWLSDWLSARYNDYLASQNQTSMAGDDCPPPEPPDNA